MNTRRIAVAVLGALALAARGARSQVVEGGLPPLARLERAVDPETYRAVAEVIDRARSQALPTEPLVDRALEGAMKRAPGPRIRTAVAALAERLDIARGMLAPSPTEADIAAGAGALGVGVPRETLRAIRSVQPDRPVAVPLGVLTELVARRVPVDRAASMVVALMRRGATPTQLVALSQDVQQDIAAGIEPGAAFDLRTRGMASSLAGGAAVATTPSAGGVIEGGFRADGAGKTAGNASPPRGKRRP
jgi:hypothetical protein